MTGLIKVLQAAPTAVLMDDDVANSEFAQHPPFRRIRKIGRNMLPVKRGELAIGDGYASKGPPAFAQAKEPLAGGYHTEIRLSE
jgi:hypothetical protein